MIRSRNPRLNVTQLEAQLTQELQADPELSANVRLVRLAATVHIRTIENTLERAEERSAARTEWPAELRASALLRNPGLQQMVLRLMALIFRDQHDVNAQLIRAQRESLSLIRDLVERIEGLEGRLEAERATVRAERLARRNAIE